jgi:hypothetical protein
MMRAPAPEPTIEVPATTSDDAAALDGVLARSFDTCPDSTGRARAHRVLGGDPPVWRMWREPNDEQERA